MKNEKALSTEDVANMLHVSKSMIYSLIRENKIRSYRVGRKVRFTESDVMEFIAHSKQGTEPPPTGQDVSVSARHSTLDAQPENYILCGQDLTLDIISNYMRLKNIPALRAYMNSYDSIIALYKNQVQVASAHLWDSETNQYNVGYVKMLMPGVSAVVIHISTRTQGLYVAKGNPKGIFSWNDFGRDDVTMVNRDYGAGSRVLLDEHLNELGIPTSIVKGYDRVNRSILSVASAVSRGEADVAVGSERIAHQVDGVDFIPLTKEQYDIVVRKDRFESFEVQTMMGIIHNPDFIQECSHISGYDTGRMGEIVAET